MIKFRKILVMIFTLLAAGHCLAAGANRSLDERFSNPSQEYAPWVFWYWMYGGVTKEAIRADLEAMKEIGLGGAYLMPIKRSGEVPFIDPPANQLTPLWWDLVKYTMEKADSLGLELGMHICDGFALAGGPWITPELSMQKVVWSETIVDGGRGTAQLAVPEHWEDYYRDIAVYALPVIDRASELSTLNVEVKVTSDLDTIVPEWLVTKGNQKPIASREPCRFVYDFGEPFTARSFRVVSAPYNYQAYRWRVSASDDGVIFYPVVRTESPRHGWQNFDEPHTFALPETTARYFRFEWTPEGSEVGAEDLDAAKWTGGLGLRELHLSGAPAIRHFEGKSAAIWRIDKWMDSGELPERLCVDLEQVKDVTASVRDGKLDLSALPEGRWRIVRMGHTSTGYTNETAGAARGLECDKFNPVAVEMQFNGWFGNIYNTVGRDLASRVLKVMHVDSWECGAQNWSARFPEEFRARRGYDLMPYLPLYAGIPIGSAEESEKVLLDIRETVAELVVDVFYETLAKMKDLHDCQFSAECVAPTMPGDGMMHYRKVDIPMGEFWLRSPTHDKPNDMLDAVHGARIYGKNIIQAEGFTQLRTMWDEYPGMMKTMADRNYALGINKMVYHVYVHNPWLDTVPGMTLDGIGLYFQRDQTWWSQARAWVDYAKRCQVMLREGEPVTDIAVFTGEDIPRRAVLPDRLVNTLPGIFGEGKVESERRRLANEGRPQREMPVGVFHSANMADPEQWLVDPLKGYAYDSFNKDVFLQAKAVGGEMVLPSGAAYRIVVFPLADRMTPNGGWRSAEVEAKIAELRAGGVTVLTEGEGLPHTRPMFDAYGLMPDMIPIESGKRAENIAWCHRRSDEADIYFLSNQELTHRALIVTLRLEPGFADTEVWDAVTGEKRMIPKVATFGNRLGFNLPMQPNGSVFIVVKRAAPNNRSLLWYGVNGDRYDLTVGPWSVEFEDGRTEQWAQLRDWSLSNQADIRYYSGKAVYTNAFDWNGRSGNRVYLDVGQVGVMAEVFVNGESCGIVWTAPHRVDVSNAIRQGTNELRIEVVNNWINRIKGVHEGQVSDPCIWTNAPYRVANEPLQTSGLLGPLTVIVE